MSTVQVYNGKLRYNIIGNPSASAGMSGESYAIRYIEKELNEFLEEHPDLYVSIYRNIKLKNAQIDAVIVTPKFAIIIEFKACNYIEIHDDKTFYLSEDGSKKEFEYNLFKQIEHHRNSLVPYITNNIRDESNPFLDLEYFFLDDKIIMTQEKVDIKNEVKDDEFKKYVDGCIVRVDRFVDQLKEEMLKERPYNLNDSELNSINFYLSKLTEEKYVDPKYIEPKEEMRKLFEIIKTQVELNISWIETNCKDVDARDIKLLENCFNDWNIERLISQENKGDYYDIITLVGMPYSFYAGNKFCKNLVNNILDILRLYFADRYED